MTRLAAVLLLSLFSFAAFPHDDSDRTDDLLKAIKKSRLIDLSHTWTNSSPIASVNPPYHFSLAATHANTRGTFGDGGQLSFTSEVMNWSGQHGAPSIDAIGHIGRDGKVYGGLDAATTTSNPDGIGTQPGHAGANLAIDQFPKDLLINRGVLLDVATLVQGNSSPLPAQFEITARHLQDAAKRQRIEVKRGDTVFIRTGWGQHFAANSALYAGEFSPGPGLDAAEWLIKQGARIVGNDTLTFEQRPPINIDPKRGLQVFPVHMRLIADKGIYIIENLDLEGLAKAKAYEFAAVVPPIKVLGGTGSAVRVFALVAHDD
jgi:kynurenine formamidase